MERPLTLVIILAMLSGALTFLGTLLSAPSQIDRRFYGDQVRAAAADGQWSLVADMSRAAVRQDARYQEALLFLALAEDRVGDPDRAGQAWSRLEKVSRENIERGNDSADQRHFLGWSLRGQGDDFGARAAWRDLVRNMGGNEGPYNRVCYLALAGETEGALAAWEGMLETQQARGLMQWSRVDPDLDAIRDDPRFEAARDRARERFSGRGRPATAF